jgi:sulfur carrier protein ThiS
VRVTVRYVFGLTCGADGRETMTLELPGDATVFEALRRLGVSSLELHAAVNGESAADGTVLRDGDEVTLIPAIQGGSWGGSWGPQLERQPAMTGPRRIRP